MIASLRGEVIELGSDFCVIECAGVGHLVSITARTAETLRRHEEAFMLTTLVVREDAMTLFGFADPSEREMFSLLRSVSSVGPKVAMNILAAVSPSDIARAITSKNLKTLQAASGVGKRMAERLVTELKDKVGAFAFAGADTEASEVTMPQGVQITLAADVDQVVGALTGLGFDEIEATEAVKGVLAADPNTDTSGTLRAALKLLGR